MTKIKGHFGTAGVPDDQSNQSIVSVVANVEVMRKVRSLFASGVAVVTTARENHLHGITVSAFTAVSLDPPLVLICIANEAASREMIAESKLFAVNILSDEQEFLSERFAARAPLVNESFEGVPYHVEVTGSPILEGVVAWYDCHLEAVHAAGDHTIFVGKVAAIGIGDNSRQPLIYFARQYNRLLG